MVPVRKEWCKHDIAPPETCALCYPPALAVFVPSHGPWTVAQYTGPCAGCDYEIVPNDMIRSDGYLGWLCWICGNESNT
jgi:hypothetical protein